MMRYLWSGMVACLLLSVSVASAGESDVLRERAGDLKRKAAQLMESGEKEATQRLIQEARELGERAQMLDRQEKAEQAKESPERREQELQRLHARMKELHVAHRDLWAANAPEEELVDIRFHIRKLEAVIAEKGGLPHSRRDHGPGSPPEALQHLERQLHRIEHIRNAADHLQAADMPDIAGDLRVKSQHMEREAREMLEHLEKQSATLPPPPPPPEKSVERALREEIEALRREVESLRKQR